MDDESDEHQLRFHVDPEHMAGVYANFADVSFSDYEFTITFARVDHNLGEGEIRGVIVSRVNLSSRCMGELVGRMQEAWSRWSTQEGIKNLPEIDPP